MTRGLLIMFHNTDPKINEHYRSVFEFWKMTCLKWKDEVDKLYILDDLWDFTPKDYAWFDEHLKGKYEVFRTQGYSWDNLNMYMFRMKEDIIGRIHHDMYIYKSGILDGLFKRAEEEHDFLTAFRHGVGGTKGFWKLVHDRFKLLKRFDFGEIDTAFFLLRKSLLDQCPDIDFAPGFVRSPVMGQIIPELGAALKEPVGYEEGGMAGVKLLAKAKSLCVIETDDTHFYMYNENLVPDKNFGYFHVWAWSTGLNILNERILNRQFSLKDGSSNYKDFLGVTKEGKADLLRKVAWMWIIDGITGYLDRWREEFLGLVKDSDYSKKEWLDYIVKFKQCHKWIKEFE